MRRLCNLLLAILIGSLSTYGQDISEKYPSLIDRVKEINQDKSLTIVTLENEEFLPQVTDGGGELTGYYKSGQIQKITRRIGLSYGVEIYEYYFTDGKLIFVYETLDGFPYVERSGKFDYTKTERNFIGRYYFKRGKLIDSETTGHNRFEDDTIDIESTLTKEMIDCLDKLEKERSNNAR
jgi:hypothetical protein